MTAGVAAGHPATVDVGMRTLAAGGSAADAAAAATLASCVAETILTGIGGGGFATHYDASSGAVTCLDFFCTVPGLGNADPPGPMRPIEIVFGDVPQEFSIGGATVAVPGVPAGVGELHRRWGRLPWRDIVAPAIDLARTGVLLPAQHADALDAVAPAMIDGVGAGVYAPRGHLLRGGDLLYHPGLAQTLSLLAECGPQAYYTGPIGRAIAAEVRQAGGALGGPDLAAYRVASRPVDTATVAGCQVYGRRDLSGTVATLASLPTTLTKLPPDERVVTIADSLVAYGPQGRGCTTNLAVVDASGNACVVTTTLGIGSGVWVPETGIHLNSMLGEGELMSPGLRPGDRMPSNMCPLVVIDDGAESAGELPDDRLRSGTDGSGSRRGVVLAAGSAGASRIRSALVHTLVNVLVEGTSVAEAIARPRFHVVGSDADGPPVVHAERGYPPSELAALETAGYEVHRWTHVNHYFGGVSAVGVSDAAGDPRRGGVGRMA